MLIFHSFLSTFTRSGLTHVQLRASTFSLHARNSVQRGCHMCTSQWGRDCGHVTMWAVSPQLYSGVAAVETSMVAANIGIFNRKLIFTHLPKPTTSSFHLVTRWIFRSSSMAGISVFHILAMAATKARYILATTTIVVASPVHGTTLCPGLLGFTCIPSIVDIILIYLWTIHHISYHNSNLFKSIIIQTS